MFKSNTLTITIVNNTIQKQQWVAFGYNAGLQNPPGVIVSVSESSLEETDKQSAQIPFKIQSIKIKTQTTSQLNNLIQIQTSDATGKLVQYTVTPMNYYEPETKIPNLVKINNPNIIISGQVALIGNINAGETMNITITIRKQSAFSNFINGIINHSKFKIKWNLLPI